jgi:hypothetical protein
MKATSVVVLLVALSLANAGWAQSTAADRKAVQTCLGQQDGKLGSKCIGIVADPCIAAANAELAKASACAARELAVWEAEIDAALKRVKTGGFPDMDRAMTQSQQTWRSSLQQLCPVFDKTDPGMLPGAANYCRLYETATRALLLRRLGEAVSEH